MNSKQVIILLAAAAACVDFANGRHHSKHTFQPIQSPIHFDSTTENDSYSNNITVKFSMIPMLGINQTFPTINSTRLDLNEDYVTIPSSDLDTLIPQTTTVEERTTSKNYNELDDEIVVHTVNAITIAGIDQYGKFKEELRQDILHQFDIISADLQELVKLFRTNENINKFLKEKSNHTILQRSIRSLPVDESSVCEVEQIALTNLRDEVKATLERTNSPGSTNCPLNYDSNTCEELVKLVLCCYNHLKDGFIEATRNNNVAIEKATLWKNILDEYQERSTRLLDDKIKSLSQTYNQVIDKFKTDIQVLQKNAIFYVNAISGYGTEACAYKISKRNFLGALGNFLQLKYEFEILEDVIIKSIIRTVYELELIENIIIFIKLLPSCDLDKIAYPALFDEMHKNNHLTNPKVLIVSEAVKQCMRDSSLDKKFTSYVRNVNDAWASKVRNNKDYGQITEFSKEHLQIFLNNLPYIIEAAYSLDDSENVLNFIQNLAYIEPSIIGFSSFYETMKKKKNLDSYQLLMLAYKVKGLMEMSNYPQVSQYYRDKLTTLKYSLPSSVIGLIWDGKSCTIRNRRRWEHLYASRVTYDSNRRHVFTWMPGNIDPDAYWDFEVHDNAKLFLIRNTLWDEYLYASSVIPETLEEYDDSDGTFYGKRDVEHRGRRYVFTWIKKQKVIESTWQLIPVNNGECFKIKNDRWKEYLYSDGAKRNYHDRRYAFTWTFGALEGVMKQEGEWIIRC